MREEPVPDMRTRTQERRIPGRLRHNGSIRTGAGISLTFVRMAAMVGMRADGFGLMVIAIISMKMEEWLQQE